MTGALKKFTTTLRQTSLDNDDNKNEYMTESEIDVLNFDEIKSCYSGRYLSNNVKLTPASNDALFIGKEKIIFIEFKNGGIDDKENNEIFRKIYDSLLIFFEIYSELGLSERIKQNNISYSRQNIEYVLVYNKDTYNKNNKRGNTIQTIKGIERQLQNSESRDLMYKILSQRGNKQFILFGIDRFEGYLFKKVYTLTKEEFNRIFIPILESQI